MSVGEFYWGYASGLVVTKVPEWGEFVLAEMTETFDKGDATYFMPLMKQTEERLGFKPTYGTGDAAFDAFGQFFGFGFQCRGCLCGLMQFFADGLCVGFHVAG